MVELTTSITDVRGTPVLWPANAMGIETLVTMRSSQRIALKTTILEFSVNEAHRSWYWALVQTVAEGIGWTKESLHSDLLYECGKVKGWRLVPGGVAFELQSTARTAMGGAELREYIQAATLKLFEKHLPGVRRSDVFARAEELMGGPRPGDFR
jgi:hypothetical protein